MGIKNIIKQRWRRVRKKLKRRKRQGGIKDEKVFEKFFSRKTKAVQVTNIAFGIGIKL